MRTFGNGIIVRVNVLHTLFPSASADNWRLGKDRFSFLEISTRDHAPTNAATEGRRNSIWWLCAHKMKMLMIGFADALVHALITAV